MKSIAAGTGAVLLAGLLSVVPAASATPAPALPDVTPVPGTQDVARGLVVRTDASDARLRSVVEESVQEQLDDVDVERPVDLTPDVTTVDFSEPVDASDAAAVAAVVGSRDDVEWAIPNRRVQRAAASPVRPDDPLFGRQVQLWDSAAKAAGGYSTKAPAFWGTSLGTGTVVAVLDTGITDHPDLRGRVVRGYDMVSAEQGLDAVTLGRFYTANDGDGRDADPSDPGDWIPAGHCGQSEQVDSSWHGTHVAGIVAARRNNRTGVSGVAPDTRVQPVRVLGRCGGWDSDVIAGIEWASGGTVPGVPANATPADVVNLSLGSYVGSRAEAATVCRAYGDVIGAALARGAVTVVAAGNEVGNADLSVPAACPRALSVAATSRSGRAAFYTNRGASVDVSAFGGDFHVGEDGVLSTINRGATTPTTSGYAEYMGTSMAAPAVSGAAAMIRSLGVPATRVEAVLERSVQPHRARSSSATTRFRGRTIDLNCTRTTCGPGMLDLSKVPVTVSFAPKSGKRTYGSSATYPVSVKLDGKSLRGGRVELRRGSAVLARGTLSSSGTARLTVKGSSWKAGRNSLRVVHRGRWASPTRTVTVGKATPTVKVSAPSRVSASSRAKVKVVVAVKGRTHPQGTLRVYDGKRRIATARLTSNGKGRRTITLPRLARGTHKIKVVYTGTSVVKGRTSATRTVRSR